MHRESRPVRAEGLVGQMSLDVRMGHALMVEGRTMGAGTSINHPKRYR